MMPAGIAAGSEAMSRARVYASHVVESTRGRLLCALAASLGIHASVVAILSHRTLPPAPVEPAPVRVTVVDPPKPPDPPKAPKVQEVKVEAPKPPPSVPTPRKAPEPPREEAPTRPEPAGRKEPPTRSTTVALGGLDGDGTTRVVFASGSALRTLLDHGELLLVVETGGSTEPRRYLHSAGGMLPVGDDRIGQYKKERRLYVLRPDAEMQASLSIGSASRYYLVLSERLRANLGHARADIPRGSGQTTLVVCADGVVSRSACGGAL